MTFLTIRYFIFWVDSSESELGILDLIHVFVETLDNCFESVCELDIIFNMDKVHFILQEIVMGGKKFLLGATFLIIRRNGT